MSSKTTKISLSAGLTVAILAVTVMSLPTFSQDLYASATSQAVDGKDIAVLKQQLSDSKALLKQEMKKPDSSYLPIFVTYIDHDKNQLVVGIHEDSPLPIEVYQERIRAIINDTPVMVDFGKYTPDVCSSRTTQCAPVYGGIQVQVGSGASTLSFADHDDSSRRGIIITGHAPGWGNTGNDVGQDTLSRVVADVVTNPAGPIRFCDCAFAEIRKDVNNNYLFSTDDNQIFKSSSASYNISGKKTSSQTSVNDNVNTSGISSGLQSGKITDIGVDVKPDASRDLLQQVIADYFSLAGDSGKPVFSSGTSNVDLYGIHHGRITVGQQSMAVYSPWESIQSELNLAP